MGRPKGRSSPPRGWSYIIAGFALIFLGGAVDITDNFESLNRYLLIGDTEAEAWLEKVGGYLIGFCLLAVGFWKWLPAIADRWKAEEALENAYRQLEVNLGRLAEAQDRAVRTERLAAIGQLSGSVAHDLRNPLGAISNALYYLNKKLSAGEAAQTDPRIEQFLEIVRSEVEHANQIITDLVSCTRISAPTLSPTNLVRIIENILSRVEARDDVRTITSLDAGLPEVLADGEQLHQVFLNLVTNAHDAMRDGGELTIAVQRIDGSVEVAFTDTGIGISHENLKKIFDPLFTSRIKGTGLGLSVCQQVISMHNGTISVASEPGEGATFTVALPLNGKGS